MQGEEHRSASARQETDDSLRSEREMVDCIVAGKLSAIDELADGVICKARARADEVLAACRAQTDKALASPAPSSRAALVRERKAEDRGVREERAKVDDVLRLERADSDGTLARERDQTDGSLGSERTSSDDMLARSDDLLGVVTHDLRSMLHAMLGYADLLLIEGVPESAEKRVREHVGHIQQAGARMNRLIGDLIDLSSVRAGRLTVTREVSDPARTIMEAVDTFRAHGLANGVSVRAEVHSSCSAPHDSARLLQVLSNLLSNAIKFSTPSGEVVVRLDRHEDELRCTVSDTGVGIPADKLESIFERFVQLDKTDRRGLGLGLYISECIVQAHGGRIWAESKVGQGSCFYFTLPLASPR